MVSGEAFCDREQETADLVRAMENAQKLFVFSERRYGKTSLVRTAMGKLPRKGYLCAYVDLWPTDSEAAFATAMAKAIADSMSISVDKLLETAKRFLGRLSPSLTVDEEGKPTLTFGLAKEVPVGAVLEEVLETPARIAAKNGPQVAVVFDEFQQILEYGSDLVERKLRSVMQHHRQVAYLFLGSRKHLIQKMVLDRNRPLYRPVDIIRWGPLRSPLATVHPPALCRCGQKHRPGSYSRIV